ncbi:MAG TPA: rhodanese-like domain-containing protein [Steroidobacteraceae bacterium]|jgi:PQQ-dependent catabolism-associated CXXCW motif protein|nr:rhodanese-like domain-containing protein [Steroidobacteraceae bacterium]
MIRRANSTLAAILALLAVAPPILAQDSFGEASRQQAPPQNQSPPAPQSQRPPAAAAPAQSARPAAGDSRLDQQMQAERQDFGIAPTKQLHAGAMHGPTPASIPGGQVITTKGLAALVQGRQTPFLLLDVLGGADVLPGALPAAWTAQPGSYDDAIQQELGRNLQQATRGNKQMPLVFYCLSNHCWMSYNASLRAIQLGYTNVLWYRGGLEAWQAAGLQTAQAGQGPR